MSQLKKYILYIALVVITVPAASQELSINEVMALNTRTITDMNGDFEDWIEIYNPTPDTVDITGYGLSDNPQDPFRWVFPEYSLAPGEFLLVWASGKDRHPTQGGRTQGVMREVYNSIGGSSVSDLTNHPSYPSNPSSSGIISDYFEAPSDVSDEYGQRMHGWINAPATGEYTFWIASDDHGELHLSSDYNPQNTQLIASVTGWTNPREWDKYNEQRSEAIHLEEGELYYIMAFMKEANGSDNLAVGWQLPDGSQQRPILGEHLFWDEGELHTNFSIKSSGEKVLLTHPEGHTVDSFPSLELPSDISYGRYPDSSNNLMYFTQATPGNPNNQQGFATLTTPPVLSVQSGAYVAPFDVTIAHPNPHTEIYYSTDGTHPTATNGQLYTAPITVNTTKTVKAIAYSAGSYISSPNEAFYITIDEELESFSSDIPLVIIHQIDQTFEPGNRTPGYMLVYEGSQPGERVSLTQEPANNGFIKGNKRGSSSLNFPKNMFGIHLLEKDGSNRNEPLLGMPAEHNWILYAPYTDKTLMRNAVAYQLSNDMGRYAPRTQFFELFLHDGDSTVSYDNYHGVYVLTERIKWSDGRLEIDKISPEDDQEPEITGGYIIKKDRFNDGEQGLHTDRGTNLAYVRPNERDITPTQSQWLIGFLNNFEEALFGSNFTNPTAGYHHFIDIGSFIDYHLITEVCKEIDGYRLSTFMHKHREGKLTMGPLWDFNLSLGNADYHQGWKPEGWYYPLISQTEYLNGWYTRLFDDPTFEQQYRTRWWQLRRGVLSDQQIAELIELNAAKLNEAQERNFERWPTLGTYVWPNASGWNSRTTYRDEVTWMLEWVMERLNWMDGELGPEASLLHYWNFNDLPEGTLTDDISPDNSMLQGGRIQYTGSSEGYMDRVDDGTLLNADMMEAAGSGLRVRNPSNQRELAISIPTNGYKDISLSYAVKRTSNGAREHSVSYQTSAGGAWIEVPSVVKVQDYYQVYSFDLSQVEDANDNQDLSIKILFEGEHAAGESGNNRFDNICVQGYEIITTGTNQADIAPADCYYSNQSIYIVNPRKEPINTDVYDINGRKILTIPKVDTGEYVFPFNQPLGVYIVRMITDGKVITRKIIGGI